MPRTARGTTSGAASSMLREIAQKADKSIGMLLDLGGPKIRIEGFQGGKVMLEEGKPFVLDTALDAKAGTARRCRRGVQESAADVAPGDTLLLNDGQIVLGVDSVSGTRIVTRVKVGGELSDRKGLNRQGGGISAPALSDKDRDDIRFAAEEGIDYIAVSFARSANDIEQARALARKSGSEARILAKIERQEAVQNLAESPTRPTPSWWRAAISASRWATRSSPACRRPSSTSRARAIAW